MWTACERTTQSNKRNTYTQGTHLWYYNKRVTRRSRSKQCFLSVYVYIHTREAWTKITIKKANHTCQRASAIHWSILLFGRRRWEVDDTAKSPSGAVWRHVSLIVLCKINLWVSPFVPFYRICQNKISVHQKKCRNPICKHNVFAHLFLSKRVSIK